MEVRMSDCRSFESNCHQSSQPRKMSIGIMRDPLARKKIVATNEDEGVMPDAETVNSKKEVFVEGKTERVATNANGGKETEATEQEMSPWITKHQKPPTSETLLQSKGTVDLPTSSGRRNKLIRKMDEPGTSKVESFTNQTSTLHANNGEKFDGFTYKRKGSKDVGSQRVEEFTFATPGDVPMSDKAAIDDKTTERRTEALKMKLWEILGTAASPKSQPSISQAPQIGPDKSKQKQVDDEKDNVCVTPKQNSDTIARDSGIPRETKQGPVTRSFTRTRASNKFESVKTTAGPSSSCKQKLQRKNLFSSEEEMFRKRNVTVNSGLRSKRMRSQTKSRKIEPCKNLFTENTNVDRAAATIKSKPSLPADETSFLRAKMGIFHAHSSRNKKEYLEPKNSREEGNSHESAARGSHKSPSRDSHLSLGAHKKDNPVDFNSPAIPEKQDHQEDFLSSPSNNVLDSQHDSESPTFKINSPNQSPLLGSALETDQMKRVLSSPSQGETSVSAGNVNSPRNLQNPYASNAQNESPASSIIFKDHAKELRDSPPRKASPHKGEKDVEVDHSESSSEDGESASSEDGSPFIRGQREGETFTAEPAIAKKSSFMLHSTTRPCKLKGKKTSKFCPCSPSPNEPSEHYQEDEQERITMLLALALENFRNKMKAAARKKSSEILMSVYEGTQSQLQNIESKIQTDLAKLISVGKSKRKRLETRFQEQREQLMLIHDKFRQDIYEHLQEWQNTLQGLEENQNELKGSVKKQKVSHQKLLAQAEETVVRRIHDAERRITAVRKMATEQLLQLRYVVAGFLDDDLLS